MSGLVTYHEDWRRWIGIHLDQPICSQTEIQLLASDGGSFEVDKANSNGLEIYRGCRAAVTGTLGLSGTGYYSTDIYQNVAGIVADSSCIHQPPFADFSNAKPDPVVRRYHVTIALSHTITVQAKNSNQLLTPWQAYADYQLTGGFALYGECAEGYEISRVSGSPESRPWQSDNQAVSDPETAAAKKVDLFF